MLKLLPKLHRHFKLAKVFQNFTKVGNFAKSGHTGCDGGVVVKMYVFFRDHLSSNIVQSNSHYSFKLVKVNTNERIKHFEPGTLGQIRQPSSLRAGLGGARTMVGCSTSNPKTWVTTSRSRLHSRSRPRRRHSRHVRRRALEAKTLIRCSTCCCICKKPRATIRAQMTKLERLRCKNKMCNVERAY